MFTLPNLPFESNALEPFIDVHTMEIHHSKHHATYVKNLNDVLPDKSESDLAILLANLSDLPEQIRNKVRNNGGGHWNHSFFWSILSPISSSGLPSPELLVAITISFGDLETFKEKFTSIGLSRFGSGWVWLVKTSSGLEIVDTPNQDNPVMTGLTPILALDVWEHAYYLKYQNRRADYITAFWNIVNWSEVNKLFAFS